MLAHGLCSPSTRLLTPCSSLTSMGTLPQWGYTRKSRSAAYSLVSKERRVAVGSRQGVDGSRSCGQGCRPMCAHEFVRIPEPKGGAPSSAGCDATTNKGGPDGHGEGRRVVCQG